MTLANGANNDAVRKRRDMVAQLRLMGYTEREITLRLATGKQPLLNPQTGEPYSRQTVHNDLVLLREKWTESAAQSINEHQVRQLAEIQEIKRQAFLDRDGLLALRAIDREMKLLGTAAPERVKIDVTINIELVTRVWNAIQQAGKDPELVLGRLAEQVERVQ
jgi:hypothetical protein